MLGKISPSKTAQLGKKNVTVDSFGNTIGNFIEATDKKDIHLEW